MPGHRRLQTRQALNAHLAWLRVAVHDGRLESRVVIEALLDVVEAVVELLPGPPADRGAA